MLCVSWGKWTLVPFTSLYMCPPKTCVAPLPPDRRELRETYTCTHHPPAFCQFEVWRCLAKVLYVTERLIWFSSNSEQSHQPHLTEGHATMWLSCIGARFPKLEKTLVCAQGGRAGVLQGRRADRDCGLERVHNQARQGQKHFLVGALRRSWPTCFALYLRMHVNDSFAGNIQ